MTTLSDERLAQIAHRFSELEARLASGTLEGDEFVAASRDYAELEPVAKVAAIARARLFCDTRAGALSEGGDFVQPLRAGLIGEDDIAADLAELTQGEKAGRRYYDQITVFKSVGTALEDLAAAALVFARSD